jgi:hypothetical protein
MLEVKVVPLGCSPCIQIGLIIALCKRNVLLLRNDTVISTIMVKVKLSP